MFVIVGACLAGIYLVLRDLFPYLEAQRTGTLLTRGHNRRKVLRDEDPARFRALLRNRTDGMIIGVMAMIFGVLWVFFGLLALLALFPIGAVMTNMTRRSRKSAKRVADEFS